MMNVNTGRAEALTKIDVVEKKYNAKWVGQFCLKTKDGAWQGDTCADVYFQEVPPEQGYSQYFGLLNQGGKLYITSAESAVEGIINCVVAMDGEIIYSRFRHDMRCSADGSVFIDGGREYIRTNSQNTIPVSYTHLDVYKRQGN